MPDFEGKNLGEREVLNPPEGQTPTAEAESPLEMVGTVVEDITSETSRAIEEAKAQEMLVERLTGYNPDSNEAIQAAIDFKLPAKLGENLRAIRELGIDSLKKIQDLVNLLGDEENVSNSETLMREHGVNPEEELGNGAFYETLGAEDKKIVVKFLKLNYLFDQEQAVEMLARHEVEARRVYEAFGEEFTPASIFIYPDTMQEVYKAEAERISEEGVKLYPLSTFMKIQIDRRLQQDFKRRDMKNGRGPVDAAFGKIGEALKDSDMYRKECAGVMVEERVHGITFQELMERHPAGQGNEKSADLTASAKLFLRRLVRFNEAYALLWHQLGSDNVVVETDEGGNPTGGIKILDLNFTEKSSEMIRKSTIKGTKEKIIQPLMQYFGFSEEEIYNEASTAEATA